MYYLLISVICYILGSIPKAYIVVKIATGKNITDFGTGNVGTMNTHRATNSKFLTALVLVGDSLKGYLSWYLADTLSRFYNLDHSLAILLAGFFVILGHNYSIFLKFKGGKGLATGFGFFLGLNPLLDLIWIASFLVVTTVSRYMVLGQMLATISIMIFAVVTSDKSMWAILAMGVLVVIRHSPRMLDIIQGKEPKMYYKIRSADPKK